MIILALDLGQHTGWALGTSVLSPDSTKHVTTTIASGTMEFRPGRYEGGGMIWLRFRTWLDEIYHYDARRIDMIAFEEVRRHIGTAAAHSYGGYLSNLTAWAEGRKIPYIGVPVGTIKRHITGRGNANKDMVIGALIGMGFLPKDDNEADALALLDYTMRNVVR